MNTKLAKGFIALSIYLVLADIIIRNMFHVSDAISTTIAIITGFVGLYIVMNAKSVFQNRKSDEDELTELFKKIYE